MEDGILIFETGFSDPVRIHMDKIHAVTTDRPVAVHMETGEVLIGKLQSGEHGEFLIASSGDRRETAIDWMQVRAINPPHSRWTGNVTLGMNVQDGNTESLNVSLGADAVRETRQDRFHLQFLTIYGEQDDAVNARNTFASLKYDYFFSPKLYGYLATELLTDTFRDLNFRGVSGAGLGYRLMKRGAVHLDLEAGLSYLSEDFDIGEDDHRLTARVAGVFSWKITDRLQFSDHLVMFPSVEDNQMQLRNEASLSTMLSGNWSCNLATILQYDSAPPDDPELDIAEIDLTWLLGLQYSF